MATKPERMADCLQILTIAIKDILANIHDTKTVKAICEMALRNIDRALHSDN